MIKPNQFCIKVVTTGFLLLSPSIVGAKDFDFCESPSALKFTSLDSLSSSNDRIKKFAKKKFRSLFNKPKLKNIAINQNNRSVKKEEKKPIDSKKPTAQQTANVVGIASIAGALIAAARGDTSTAVTILDAGSKVINATTSQTTQSNIGGNGSLAALNGSANAIHLSGNCGLSKTEASESARRINYNAILKAESFGAFDTDASLKRQVDGQGVPSGFSSFCSAAGAQVKGSLPSYNQAILSSDTLVNGQPLGLTCSGNQNSASQVTACTALKIKYSMQQAAFACHYSCGIGK